MRITESRSRHGTDQTTSQLHGETTHLQIAPVFQLDRVPPPRSVIPSASSCLQKSSKQVLMVSRQSSSSCSVQLGKGIAAELNVQSECAWNQCWRCCMELNAVENKKSADALNAHTAD